MSWGATAYTPIATYNEPPFGFYEVKTPTDFKVCNENPWGTGDRMKEEIQNRLKEAEYKRRALGDEQYEREMGYDFDNAKLDAQQQYDCITKKNLMEGFYFENPRTKYFLMILIVFGMWWLLNR